MTRKRERINSEEINIIKVLDGYHEAFLARTSTSDILLCIFDCLIAAELTNKYIFTLTLTYYSTLLVTLYPTF
jgi:hypothetical protein